MKKVILIFICLIGLSVSAQTEKELVGKWMLVKWTKNGRTQDIKAYYKTTQVLQIFEENGDFESRIGSDSQYSKWKLTQDNSQLVIVDPSVSITSSIDYFDAKKRIITSETGTFEYKKIPYAE
ncbi:hypothetical protein C8C83_0403 [Flavobacterium sp. 90]|uniref:hypothetical protein n=1 Tax=unclassified Flavobacterium TaxID=196869 RepID=UPI000F286EE0|nr:MULTISPECIES: hypothetical protein [unclassified Flavobacterium]RKR08812.1 hypothetical protein C8C82_0698 [Flavobacterium sp. 81]TCK52599.1 hypothetical protein C8C83_0403 [Flavobacterium sp. 90]